MTPPPSVLVGAFEPFGGRRTNRAWDAVARLPVRPGVERVRLPVDFARLTTEIPALVARAPAALILVGETARARRVQLERVALNIAHARIPDNAGACPRGARLAEGAPLALEATWDADAVLRAVLATGAPAELSHHAGTYACNAALYLALLAAAAAPAAAPAPRMTIGFVHVPVAGWPVGPTLGALARAIDAVILTSCPARVI